ncbi:MAG: hypothetical protein K2H30_06345 [Clostridia bacterium]|nr:hypothetical protein [Clostridia bacterium]
MAKRKSNRGGYAAKKNTLQSVAGIIAAIALLLGVAYVITSLAVGIRAGAPVWNPLQWGKAGISEEVEKPDDDGDELTAGDYAAIDENGNLMRSGVVYSMPASLTFIGDCTVSAVRAAVSDVTMTDGQSVTICATVTPNSASDKRVTWTSDSQYVTVTPLSEGSNIATVTLTNYSSFVFSENAVTITCTSVIDTSKYATCSVSRLATLKEVVLRSEITPSTIAYGGDSITASAWAEAYEGISSLYFGDVKNIVIDNISLVYNSTLFNKITQFLKAENIDVNFADYYGDCGVDAKTWQVLTPFVMFGVGSDSTKFNNAFISACKEINGDCTVDVLIAVRADYVFNGVNFGCLYSYETYTIDFSALWVDVEDVEIGGDIVVTP